MSKKRVFSNNKDINYQDYMNNKKGIALIHYQKSIGRQKMNRFLSYQEFLILTRTFFLYSQKHRNLLKAPFTIYQATISKVSYDKTNEHISSCDFCLHVKDPQDFLKCREFLNVLYPYGHYLSESQEIYYPSTLDLTKWCSFCNDKEPIIDTDDYNIPTSVSIDEDDFECPIGEDGIHPITGHKYNCECCKLTSSLRKKTSLNYTNQNTNTNISKNTNTNCGLCINTTSLFSKKR
jgi:hypothetical protein